MAVPPGSEEGMGKSGISGNIFNDLPDVSLIDLKQWQYLQRRYHLTPRELQVAKFACRGLTTSEIALKLRVRPGTVKTHLKIVFAKTRTRRKITLLLRFISDVNKFFAESAPAPPIPIVDVEKPRKKTAAPTETLKKEK